MDDKINRPRKNQRILVVYNDIKKGIIVYGTTNKLIQFSIPIHGW